MLRIRRFEERCVELYSAGDDPRLHAPVHRRGGRRRGRAARARPRGRRRRRPTASTATRWPAAFPCDALMAEMFGKDERLQPRPRRLDAPLRRRTPLLRRQRHRRRAACRSRSGWRSPTRCAAAAGVTACFFGEGAVAEGEFHESLNLAALWRLPVLFCCENNLYAMGTALARSAAADRPRRCAPRPTGCRPWSVDGMDVAAVRRRPGGPSTPSAPAAGRASWSCAPTASAPTRCTTRSATATRTRSTAWSERDPIDGCSPPRSAPTARSTTPSSTALEAEVAAEIDARRRRRRGRRRSSRSRT